MAATSLSLSFLPRFYLNTKGLTDSRERADKPRLKTFSEILPRIQPGRRSLIYYFSRHLATMDYSPSVHTRVDTLAQLLPLFFEIVCEKMGRKDPTVFKRQNRHIKRPYYSPSSTDRINMLLSGQTSVDTVVNAKVFNYRMI